MLSRPSPLEGVRFGGLGSAERTAAELARPPVRTAYLDRLDRAFARSDRGERPPSTELLSARSAVLRSADAALAKLGRLGAQAVFDRGDHVGLEAVILLSGRPSILVKNGGLDLDSSDPDLETWQSAIALMHDAMKVTIRSVGRIDRSGFHAGTGFVVAPGLVMTNRHVAQALAHQPSGGGGSWTMLGGTSTIDFAMEYGSERTSRFRISGIVYAGPAPIGSSIDLALLDLAVVEVERTNSEGESLPPPLPLTRNTAGSGRMSEVYMVGYPARPSALPRGSSAEDLQLIETLKRVFRARYGVKRLALGSITHPLGQVPGDSVPWAVGHDATTLGGNSGSCVAALGDEGSVLGLHFGGYAFDHNLAHVLGAIPVLREAPATALGLEWR